MRLRKGFWIYFPVALFAWISPVTSVKADALGEWTYSESIPCNGSVEVVDNTITLHGPDGCPGANWVKIETTIPADVDTIDFLWSYQTYDGAYFDPPQIGVNGVYTQLTNQSNASGSGSISVSEGDMFTFRQYSLDSCCQPGHLTISNLSLWNGISQTTTTTSTTTTTTTTSTTSTTTTTTTSTTTTTEPPTTTTESTTTTSTEPQTTTTSTSTTSTTVPEPSTTLVENTTSTTTTSTVPPAPEPIVEVPTGTTTTVVEEPTPEETIPEETTTTTEPETTTTETYPDTTVEETTTTTLEPNLEPNLEPMTEEEVAAVVEELTTIEEITPEVLSEVVDALNSDSITEEQVQAIVDAVVENLDTLTEITAEVLDEVLNVLESDSVTEEQVQEIVDTILATDVTSDQATQLATSAAVLESITGDQATEVFASIDTGELSGEEAAAIVEALLEAPTEVKEAFEEEINVFEGGFDEYVPTNSTISVGVRRVVVAATTVSFILPAPVVSRRQSIL
jgi:polyhydroxyalkanoate synthesis regulator phasin